MRKLMKYLKKSTIPIIMVLLLLVVQAYCDLSIPKYTSDVVNVGIQQGGIDNIAPQRIRVAEMQKLMLFMEDNQKELINKNYQLSDYNGIAIYSLEKANSATTEKLNSAFEYPMLLVYGIEQGFSEKGGKASAMMGDLNASGFTQETFAALSSMPMAQKNEIVNQIKEKSANLKKLDSSIMRQMDIKYVENEYKACGIDTDAMQTAYIWNLGLKMLGVALIIGLCTVLVTLLASRIGAFFARDLRKNLFEKVINFSSADMDHFSTASLITRCTNDVQQVQMMVTMLLRMVFYAPIIGIGALFMAYSSQSSMTWVIGVAVIAILTLVILLLVFTMPKFKRLQKIVDKVNVVTREILTGLPVIRAFTREKKEEQRFDAANTQLKKVNIFVNSSMALMMPTMMFIMNAITVLIVWVGAGFIDTGTMQVGDLMAFIQYSMQIIMSFLILSMISIMLPRALVSANRIAEVLETKNYIKDSIAPLSFPLNTKGIVEFRNVSFRYPNAEENVLEHISFVANLGETTAFIGSTGSGKSTIANLIPRFFDVTDGQIFIDGRDIRDVRQKNLREIIGYVPQKAMLFSGTIESNIGYNGNGDKMAIRQAAAIAQAADFIGEMDAGYNSEISQGGTNVSGGQRQRIAIARTIAKKPLIYLFDDCFSALDYKTDAKLRQALARTTKESTVLVIAQRISTIINAEKIVVLDDGKVAGIGTHQELLKSSEVYREIALSQLSREELGI
ncbi:MAG: ABC transporter ATP-binding protein [Clostridiales bacterium]